MNPNTGAFRGTSPYASMGFATGGNEPVNPTTGAIAGTDTAKWHPTVVYLFGLLVVEWAIFVLLTKYL